MYQIGLLQSDINLLWSIANYICLGPQETSINESFHSYLKSKRPPKTSKVTIKMLEIMVGICCLTLIASTFIFYYYLIIF
jgi:hypothetical protein